MHVNRRMANMQVAAVRHDHAIFWAKSHPIRRVSCGQLAKSASSHTRSFGWFGRENRTHLNTAGCWPSVSRLSGSIATPREGTASSVFLPLEIRRLAKYDGSLPHRSGNSSSRFIRKNGMAIMGGCRPDFNRMHWQLMELIVMPTIFGIIIDNIIEKARTSFTSAVEGAPHSFARTLFELPPSNTFGDQDRSPELISLPFPRTLFYSFPRQPRSHLEVGTSPSTFSVFL